MIGRCLSALAFSMLLVLPAVADFKAGMEAYEQGDFDTALLEWRPAAEQGLVEAQYNLALIYYHGKGIPVDLEQAQQWYLRAAEQNYVRAQYRVAEMYEKGEGPRKDLIQAYFWFRVAGTEKYSDARKRRRKVAQGMTPEQIAYADMLVRQHKRDAKAKN